MESSRPDLPTPPLLHTVALVRGFLKKPREVASIAPSSPFLIRQVLAAGAADRARLIVELGPGTGVVTEQILRRMRSDATLVAVEANADFVELMRRKYRDPRLTLHRGVATEIEEVLGTLGGTPADLVISGIPFSTMERDESLRTLEAVRRVLAPEGRFVAYQVRDHVRRLAEPIFGAAEVRSALWNIPPMRVFSWRRENGDSSQTFGA